jgi:hypothetical protein
MVLAVGTVALLGPAAERNGRAQCLTIAAAIIIAVLASDGCMRLGSSPTKFFL